MTRIVVFLLLVTVAVLATRAAVRRFLASPRGREIRAVWQLLRQLGASAQRDHAAPDGGASRSSAAGARPGVRIARTEHGDSTTRLVRCHACGTHVPEDRALLRPGGRSFCCESCARAAAVP